MTIIIMTIFIMILTSLGITSADFDPNAWIIFSAIMIHSLVREFRGK